MNTLSLTTGIACRSMSYIEVSVVPHTTSSKQFLSAMTLPEFFSAYHAVEAKGEESHSDYTFRSIVSCPADIIYRTFLPSPIERRVERNWNGGSKELKEPD